MRRLRNVFFALLIVAGLLWGGLALLERSGFLEKRVLAQMQEFVAGDVHVGDVDLQLSKFTLSVKDFQLAESAGSKRLLSIPQFDVHGPFHFTNDGKMMPKALTITKPTLELVEREDGTFSPLNLVRSVGPIEFAPSIEITDGTLTLSGRGPVQSLLSKILRDDLVRTLSDVDLSTYPMPASAADLLGFSGSIDVPIGLPMRVSGVMDRKSFVRMHAAVADIDLGRADLRKTLRPQWQEWLDAHLDAGHFALDVDLGGDSGRNGIMVRAKAKDLKLEHEAFSIPLAGVSGEAEFDGTQLRVLNVRAQDGEAKLTADVLVDDVATGALRATLRGEGLRFESGLVAALTDPVVRRAIDDYSPLGTFDLFVDLTKKSGEDLHAAWRAVPRPGASASFAGHLRKTGKFVGFPYRLRDLTGEVSGKDGHIDICRITGRHNGGDVGVVEGFVDTRPEGTAFEINVRATKAPFDQTLRDALDVIKPGIGSLVDSFHPEGFADIYVSVVASHTQSGANVKGHVETAGAKMRYDPFPYALDDVNGAVEFDDDVYRIKALDGKHGNGRVHVSGTIAPVGSDAALDLRVEARDIEVDADLKAAIAAIAPEAADAFSWLQPAGPFDLDVVFKREPGQQGRFKALLTPKGVHLIPKWLPVPLEGVVGKAEFGTLHDDPNDRRFWLELDPLRAKKGTADITCRARFEDGKAPRFELIADDLMVDEELRDRIRAAAESIDGERARLAGLLDHLQPNGKISFRYARDGETRERLSLRLNGVDGRVAETAGGELHDVHGTAVADLLARTVVLTDIEGLLGPQAAPFSIRSARFDAAGPSMVMQAEDIAVKGLELDERMFPLLGAAFGKFAAVAKPRGRIDALFRSVRYDAPLDATAARAPMQFAGEVTLADCELAGAFSVKELSGKLTIEQHVVDGSPRLSGAVSDLGFVLAGFRCEHLAAQVSAQAGGFEVMGLAGDVAGGSFPAAGNWLRIAGDAVSSFDGRFELANADLRELLLLRGGTATDVEGRVSATVTFEGDTASPSGIRGGGRIDVREGRLWDLPIFATLYRISFGRVFGEQGKPVFKSGHVAFELRRGEVILNEVKFDGPLLSVEGRGFAGPTGVDVIVAPMVVDAQVPIVSPILDFLKRRVISYRIYGPWARPRVEYWNDAVGIFSTDENVTQMARLPPRRMRDWNERF